MGSYVLIDRRKEVSCYYEIQKQGKVSAILPVVPDLSIFFGRLRDRKLRNSSS